MPECHTGIEYEAFLCEKLRNVGVPFFSEDVLREQGFFKTPDIKLQVLPSILDTLTTELFHRMSVHLIVAVLEIQ